MKRKPIAVWMRAAGAGLLAVAAAGASAAALGVGCQAAPTPIPLRTFERPQKVAAVCLSENVADGGVAAQISPLPLGACPPVPFNVNGTPFPNHMMALVTQQTRGQLAVVDLTAGVVVDEDRSTPGINFIPVGANPSDVVVSPDFDPTLTFVASRDPNSFAIYGIDNTRLLGDSVLTSAPTDGGVATQPPPLTLPDLRVCSLPQPPIALGVITLPATVNGAPSTLPPYVIAAVLAPWAGAQGAVLTIDPRPFSSTPIPNVGQLPPGIVQPCTILGTGVTTLAGQNVVPQTWQTGPAWPDGVPYADAGATTPTPPLGPSCLEGPGDGGLLPAFAESFDAGPTVSPSASPQPSSIAVRDDAPIAYVADGALPLIHVLDFSAGGAPVEVGQFFATRVSAPTTPVPVGSIALSPATSDHRRYLYAVDGSDYSLMVFDATNPTPPSTPETPLLRPHPELNPLQPVDRITFSAPVAAFTFATHDWPLLPPNLPTNVPTQGFTGLLCNPNPEALVDGGGSFVDGGLGGFYRADKVTTIQGASFNVTNLPTRLRGVFAFVTLSNGNLVTVDVDDWDAPCRRPDPMTIGTSGGSPPAAFGQPGVLAIPQQSPSGPDDLDPYHAPLTTIPTYLQTGVTEEAFFPVSAPNRIRSGFLLRDDPTTGQHAPFVVAVPQLFDSTGAPFSSPNGSPIILPTALPPNFVDPTYVTNPTVPDPNTVTTTLPLLQSAAAQDTDASAVLPATVNGPTVRVSFDEPTAQIDQDWTVTFEGVLPTASNVVADMTTTNGFETVLLRSGPALAADAGVDDASADGASFTPSDMSTGARFCSRGIEDWDAAKARVEELTSDGRLSIAADQLTYTADYVEITDDLVAITDPYWTQPLPVDCWDNEAASKLSTPDGGATSALGQLRYNTCFSTFGPSGSADTTYARDFPIVHATDDSLEIGRWAFPTMAVDDAGVSMPVTESTTNRTIVGQDPSNVPFLKFATCCFHAQPHFKVRTGGEWVTVGTSSVGLLHHVGRDPQTGACTVRCDDPSLALMNSRAFEVQSPPAICNGSTTPDLDAIGRDSPFAMRNPMFSFMMWGGCGRTVTRTPRDAQWRFSLHGGFSPVAVNIAGTSGVPVAPESMLGISPFGQLAVVDGSEQGLVMIDLNTLGFAHTPYF